MRPMISRMEAVVSGRVQMVMFRDFVKRKARRMGITGWVKNETNGTVRVVAEGEEEALRNLQYQLGEGSLLSRVDSVEARILPATGEFTSFTIYY